MISKICGHRGAAKYKPENTISGFEWCVKNNINWSECDVQLTDENIALIIHDQTLDRTSNAKGMVQKVKLDQLESINVGAVNSKESFYQKIPTLEELLTFCKKSNLNLNIEMKFYKPIQKIYRKKLVKTVLNTIKKTCINYRLRFLDINFFKGDLPTEAIDKLKNLEDIHNTRIDSLKIMAPSIMFRLKKTDDPILFAPLGNNYFYMIHKWGNDLNGLRKLRMWPFMSLTNLLITLLIVSFLITLLTPLKVFTKTPDSSSFWLVFFFMFKAIVSIVLFLGVSLGKSFNPQIWNSKYNKS